MTMHLSSALPAGPRAPKIKQMKKFIKEPLAYLSECKNKYGNIFTIKTLGQPPYVVVSDPNDIKQLFMSSSEQLHTGEINGSIFKPVHGQYSLLTMDGEKHMQHRKLILPSFHGARIHLYGQIMSELTREQIKRWRVDTSFPIFPELRNITLNIILRSIFGINDTSTRFEHFKKVFRELITTIKSPYGLVTLLVKKLHVNLGPLTPWAKIKRLRKEIDQLLYHEINERRKIDLSERVDVLSLLLQAKDENMQQMPDHEIRDEMWSLLSAGHDTSAAAMTWSMYYILSNKEVLQKIRLEIASVLAEGGALVNNLNKLEYLDATVKETLRIMPVVPHIARLTKQEYKLNNYVLPKGVAIIPAIYLVHHETALWEQPEKFLPERFYKTNEKPYTYLPFGGSIRRCIGAAFAHYEMKIVLAEILMNTELELVSNDEPQAVRKGIVMEPSKGVPIILRQKRGELI